MKISSIDYSINSNSLDIFLSGCNPPHCTNCCNPETWDFNVGIEFTEEFDRMSKYFEHNPFIENIFIVGGEPLHQPQEELLQLLYFLNNFDKKIWLFTRTQFISQIPIDILSQIDYIKLGKYDTELLTNDNIQFGIKLASSNQEIFSIERKK